MPRCAEGYVVGVFDLFHIGHLDAVRHAADGCDRLIVGVADDDLVRHVRGARPFVPQIERRQIVSSLRCVAEVLPVSDLDLLSQVRRHGIDVVFAPDGDDVAQRLVSGADPGAVPVVRLRGARDTASTAVRAALSSCSHRTCVA